MNSSRQLTFIITTFNSAEVIDACLNKINFDNYEVIVVDNNSSDKTTEIISEKYPLVNLIKNKKNYGYGRANNIGLRATTTPYALILNPDAFIFEKDLEKIIAMMDKNLEIGIGAPVLLNFYPLREDDRLQEIAVINNNLIKDFGDFKAVKYIIGACEILRMEFFKKIGFFDEKIFLYYEDDEICHRTILNNKICAVCTNALAYHIGQGSSGTNLRGIYRRFWHRALSKFYWKEKQKGFFNAYFSAIKLSLSFLFQAIFYGVIFNSKKLFQNLGSLNGTLSYLIRLSAFDNNDNPRG
jgi:N-acetylglucosaminyl-diphospho-decaprenol L-rhamnosyltransferase